MIQVIRYGAMPSATEHATKAQAVKIAKAAAGRPDAYTSVAVLVGGEEVARYAGAWERAEWVVKENGHD